MRKLAVALLLSVVAVALLAVPSAAKLETAEMTTAAVIEDAFNRGDISRDEKIPADGLRALCALEGK